MRWRGFLFVLLGLILSIGQPIHALYFSGQSLGRVAVAPTPHASAPPQGPSFALDSAMSPLRVLVTADVTGPSQQSARFEAVLMRDGFEAWRGPLLLTSSRDGARHEVSEVIHTLEVDSASTWMIALVRTGGRNVSATDIQIELRRNVLEPSAPIVIFGAALVLAGVLLLATDLRAARVLRNAWRHSPPEIA